MIRLDVEPTPDIILKLIENHSTASYTKLRNYYNADHDITDREIEAEKPNNRLVHSYPVYIVDVITGYFMGIPVSYSSANDEFMERLQEVFDMNDEQDHNSTLTNEMGVVGGAYEILYADEESKPRFGRVPIENVILVYDTSINPKLRFGIYYYTIEDILSNTEAVKVEVYTTENIIYYNMVTDDEGKKKLNLEDETAHFFGDVPINEFKNNEHRTGDFEKVMTLIDAYDKAQSDTANDFEYFADAYLALVGMSGTDSDDIKKMKEDRVILLDEQGEANWLVKAQEFLASQEFKDRLNADIHKFAMVPDLTDEAFGANLSGISLQYKLWGMEQKVSSKERHFKKGLQRRVELIAHFLGIKGANYDYTDIDMQFSRNIPANLLEKAEVVQMLFSILSKKTLLGMLPNIQDVDAELERIEEETQGMIDLDAPIVGDDDEPTE